MNEPRYPMDDELNQFEQELKSLSPRSLVSLTQEQNEFSMQASAPIARASSSIEIPAPAHEMRSSDRSWLKTVILAWSSGLAAGLLLSWGWNAWSKSQSGLVYSNLPSSDVTTHSTDQSIPDQIAEQRRLKAPLEQSGDFDQNEMDKLMHANRLVALDAKRFSTLHPLMPLESIVWDHRQLQFFKQFKNHDQHSAIDRIEQTSTVFADENSARYPTKPAQPLGQRQLLKAMMESGSLSPI